MRAVARYPAAAVLRLQTNGLRVNRVHVHCPYCRGVHVHSWHDEVDGLRHASCVPYGAVYRIAIDARARLEAMREHYSVPDGVVGLVPLRVGFAFEIDGPGEDVVGIVLETTLGKFAVWLPMQSAIGLAGQLVEIAENADELRLDYLERLQTSLPDRHSATNAAGPVSSYRRPARAYPRPNLM